MARIEIDGIYKHAPLTNAQLNSVTRRNLDREIVIKRDAVTDRATLIPNVTTPATDAGAYPVNYIYAMNYDTTDDGGVNPNIRRHIPTLEFLGNSAVDTAGSNWINVETGTYNYVTSGSTLQTAVEQLDSKLASNTLKYIIDGSTQASLISSTDGATPANTLSGTGTYNMLLGKTHTVSNSSYTGILSGESNVINASTHSLICGGTSNYIDSINYSLIGGGSNNYIALTGQYSSIVGGYKNYIWQSGQYSFIGGGEQNYITASSDHVFIGGGYNNYVGETSSHGSIVSGYQNTITSISPYAFIGGGRGNYIHSSDWGAVVGGYGNYIMHGSDYSSIGGGSDNYIGQSSVYAVIAGGKLNYISSSGTYGFIGAGQLNYIIEGSTYAVIVGGYVNYIQDGSDYCFIGGGFNNVIEQDSSYSAILGGTANILGASSTLESTFIIGSNIDISAATSYQFNNTTYMNNATLWNRGLVLKDRTGNQGDALIIESIDSNGMPLVTWGSVSGSGSYSGTDPISGSTGMYTAASKGSSTLVTTNSYIVVENAENTAGNSVAMVGTAFDPVGYNFTNVSATTYGTIIADMLNVSSAGLVIEAGYRYQIDVDSIALTWGKNTSINRPKLTVSYKPAIIFSTTNYTFGPNSGAVTGDLVLSDTTSGNYDFTSTDANATCPHLMLTYNSTAKKINFVLKDIYASSLYVYKLPATYTSILSGSTMDITWNPDLYPLPTTSDLVTFWNSDPATNGGNPGVTISSVVGNTVTININYGPHTNEPCWVYVKGRLPVMSVILKYTITKTTI